MDATAFYLLGTALIAVGIIIIVVAIISASTKGNDEVKGAGIVMIGPVPIIFGTDKESIKTVLLLAFALTVALIVAVVIFYWLLR